MVTPITTIFTNWLSANKTYIWVGLFVVLLLAAVFYYVISEIKLKKNSWNLDVSNKRPNDDKQDVNIFFFSVDWCPHCIKAKVPWQEFKLKYHGKKYKGNGVKINCVDHDCTDPDLQRKDTAIQLTAQYKVKGYPTVIMVKGTDGDPIDFDAQISLYTLEKFLEDMV